MGYCVFWYPTIYQQELVVLENYKDENEMLDQSKCCIGDKDIADEQIPFRLDIKFEADEGFRIKFTPKRAPEELFEIKLTKEDRNEDGFVLYSFDSGLVPPEHYGDFKTVLCRNVYHTVKQFYHIHETNEERDRSLEAFIPDDKDVDGRNLNIADNKALIHFLKSFEKIFQGYAKNISDWNKVIQERENSIDYIESLLRKLYKLRQRSRRLLQEDERRKYETICRVNNKNFVRSVTRIGKDIVELSKICGNALIEYTYYKTLAHSKNNISFCIDINIDNKNVECRKKALNIRNSVRYIENIKNVNQNRFNRFAAYNFKISRDLQEEIKDLQEESKSLIYAVQRSGKQSTELGFFGLVVSLIVAWFPAAVEIIECIGKKESKFEWERIVMAGLVTIVACIFYRRFKKRAS